MASQLLLFPHSKFHDHSSIYLPLSFKRTHEYDNLNSRVLLSDNSIACSLRNGYKQHRGSSAQALS